MVPRHTCNMDVIVCGTNRQNLGLFACIHKEKVSMKIVLAKHHRPPWACVRDMVWDGRVGGGILVSSSFLHYTMLLYLYINCFVVCIHTSSTTNPHRLSSCLIHALVPVVDAGWVQQVTI